MLARGYSFDLQILKPFAFSEFGVILGVKTCEVLLCFLAIIFLGSIVLTS